MTLYKLHKNKCIILLLDITDIFIMLNDSRKIDNILSIVLLYVLGYAI